MPSRGLEFGYYAVTLNALGGTATPVFHMGTAADINDGDLSTRVDTWNGDGIDPLSYVGIVWDNPQNALIGGLRVDFATFADGGWFGPNNLCPDPSGILSPAYLTQPDLQTTTDGGITWVTVAHTSDYLTALNGHQVSASGSNPTLATAVFRLNSPASEINGIRLVGSEGGIGSRGFLGVFELAVLRVVPATMINPIIVDEPRLQFCFEFDSQAGVTYAVQRSLSLSSANWQTVATITGDGTRKFVSQNVGRLAELVMYRVVTQ